MIMQINKFNEDKNKEQQKEKESSQDKDNINKESEEILNLDKKNNFFKKIKSEKKSRIKVELGFWGLFFLLLILGINFSGGTGGNYNYNSTNPLINNNENKIEEKDLYDKLENNYKSSASITTIKDGNVTNLSYDIERSYTNNEFKETITKKENDQIKNYSKSDTGEFYVVKSDSSLELTEEETIFNLISYKYLNSDNIKKYISKGITDYTTNYSNGNKLISYKIMLKDILLDMTNEEYITINVTTEQQTLIFDIDYTNLLKSDTIDSCNVKIIYTNISDIEEKVVE